MIRINLLPTKAVVRVTTAKTQLIIGGVVILVSLLGLLFWANSLKSDIKHLDTQIKEKQQELKKVQAARKKLDIIKKTNEKLKQKMQVIENIEKSRTGPVWLMDQLTDAVSRFQVKDYRTGRVTWLYKDDKIFLKSVKISGSKLEMDGTAINNTYLVAFLNNLKYKKDVFKSVSLKYSDTEVQNKAKVRKFKVVCNVNLNAKPLVGGPASMVINETDAEAGKKKTESGEQASSNPGTK